MHKKSSIKYFILFFTSISLYALITIFIANKPSYEFESSISPSASKEKNDKLIKLDGQHQIDFFYNDDDNENDTDSKVKGNCFFTGAYTITKPLFLTAQNYSLTKFKTYRSFTKEILLMICVFRL